MTVAIMVAIGVPILVIAVSHQLRDSHGNHETAMTVAMALGMMAGLTSGVVAGLLAPADLWPSTAAGVVAGIIAGVVAGAHAGLMAVLEGAMAGLMGGAMGAMMGGMMPDRAAWLTASTAVLTVATGAGLVRVLLPGHHEGHHGPMVPGRVYVVAGGATAIIGAVAWVATGPLVHRLPLPTEHQHLAPVDITVSAQEFGFSPAVVQLAVGKPVRLRLVNEGSQGHDLTVPGLEYRLAASRDRRAEPPGLHIYAADGDTGVLEIIPLRTGEFKAYCSVAGHKQSGMTLVIRVVSGE